MATFTNKNIDSNIFHLWRITENAGSDKKIPMQTVLPVNFVKKEPPVINNSTRVEDSSTRVEDSSTYPKLANHQDSQQIKDVRGISRAVINVLPHLNQVDDLNNNGGQNVPKPVEDMTVKVVENVPKLLPRKDVSEVTLSKSPSPQSMRLGSQKPEHMVCSPPSPLSMMDVITVGEFFFSDGCHQSFFFFFFFFFFEGFHFQENFI